MRRLFLCIWVSACNPLFGLDETILVDASVTADDRDSDGVLDGVDNCPDIANSLQQDVDADLIGDACDPCSFQHTATLDRDMDNIPADSDRCPAMADASQTDGDGDGIGDFCDPNPTSADMVRCFGDLVTNVPAAWPIADPWKWIGTSGSGYIIHQPSTAIPFWLGARASGLRSSQLAVQIGITSPSPPTNPVMLANGVAVGAADQSAFAGCELVAVMTDTSVRLQLSDSTGSLGVTALPFTTTHLTLGYRTTSGGVELTCTAHGSSGERQVLAATSSAPFDPAVLYLTATNSTAAFHSVSIYEMQ